MGIGWILFNTNKSTNTFQFKLSTSIATVLGSPCSASEDIQGAPDPSLGATGLQ